MESLNRAALGLLEEAIDFAEEIRVGVHHLDNEAVVVDFGVHEPGGIEAGLLLAEIQTGGLATVQSRIGSVGGTARTHVELSTDHPKLALLGSAFSDWRPEIPNAIGSGPARLFEPQSAFRPDDYEEDFDFAVLSLEADELPGESFVETVASRCGVSTSGVFVPTFSIRSLPGTVSIAARAAEVTLLRLNHLGYDTSNVRSVSASAPVAPIGTSTKDALVMTNDAIAHGGQVHLVVDEAFDRFDEVPFGTSAENGDSMRAVFEQADWDLHDVSAGSFAPAAVTIDVRGGDSQSYGERRDAELKALFEG